MLRFVLFVLLAGYLLIGDAAAAPRTFGHSISQGLLTHDEQSLFTYNGTGYLSYFWFTGGWDGIENTRFRIYVDGETSPSIEFDYFMGHGIGFGDQTVWGTQNAGKGARHGAVFNTFKIPFSKMVRISGQLPSSVSGNQGFWFVVRGVEGAPLMLGSYQLPDNARLKLHKQENLQMKPLDFVDLIDTHNAGAVYHIALAVSSGNLNFLEGCVRGYIGSNMFLLSSGTEDYFQSAFYFDGGPFHFEGAGLTHLDKNNQFSAYKFHDYDPLFFEAGGFQVKWRNGDTVDPKSGLKCTNDSGSPAGNPQNSVVTTYAWVYEW